MGRPAGWMHTLTGRGAMRSPGAPSLRSEIERLFWEQIEHHGQIQPAFICSDVGDVGDVGDPDFVGLSDKVVLDSW